MGSRVFYGDIVSSVQTAVIIVIVVVTTIAGVAHYSLRAPVPASL